MKIMILGGFLGAGKTTILMQLAKYLTVASAPDMHIPVVVLENEISPAGIDDRLLSQADLTVENIFAGCICCTSSASLCQSIQMIEERYAPEWLLIESTGLAYPDSIRTTIRKNTPWPAEILAIADAKRWEKVSRAMPNFILSQLTDASIILINKIDLVDEKKLGSLHNEIREFNRRAEIHPLNALKEQDDIFWKNISDGLFKDTEVQ